ncbi:MAG: HipA domain-containing protein [Candidatus Omnitrophica bacterium]|nr:HipA domain-containing protein [Candidatus Omnitrophota bacterium]
MICYRCGERIEDKDETRHGLHKQCFMEWFALDSDVDFGHVALKSTTSSGPEEKISSRGIASSFFQGKFKKYSAMLNNERYILKVKDDRFPELPPTEFLCNRIAVSLGLDVPSFYFIKFKNNVETFVSRNFMQDHIPADLVHIYHFVKEGEEFDYETVIKILKNNTGRAADIKRFVELCIFDALIGNHDRHGRNLAIVRKAKECFLSPFYDNPAYLGMEEDGLLEAMHEPKGKIVVKDTLEPSIADYYREAKRLGYSDIADSFIEKLDLEKIKTLVDTAFISQKRKKAFFSLVERRYGELKNEV